MPEQVFAHEPLGNGVGRETTAILRHFLSSIEGSARVR